MTTLRQIERLFNGQDFRRLCRELMSGRIEACSALDAAFSHVIPVAALGLIRLDELSQSSTPLYRRLLNVLLSGQEKDGGWGDPLITALCVRALLCGSGAGEAIGRALTYLAALQKSEGIWPREPIRRMPADSLASAFILLQLGDRPLFRESVRFHDAVDWFTANGTTLDPQSRRLWDHARIRCRILSLSRPAPTLWSVRRPAA